MSIREVGISALEFRKKFVWPSVRFKLWAPKWNLFTLDTLYNITGVSNQHEIIFVYLKVLLFHDYDSFFIFLLNCFLFRFGDILQYAACLAFFIKSTNVFPNIFTVSILYVAILND